MSEMSRHDESCLIYEDMVSVRRAEKDQYAELRRRADFRTFVQVWYYKGRCDVGNFK